MTIVEARSMAGNRNPFCPPLQYTPFIQLRSIIYKDLNAVASSNSIGVVTRRRTCTVLMLYHGFTAGLLHLWLYTNTHVPSRGAHLASIERLFSSFLMVGPRWTSPGIA